MGEVDKDYELDILRMVINQYLDESTSFTESSLNALENRRDQVVWDVTTKIYHQSGYRVEFSLVRDIVDSRIRILRNHLSEEARRAAEQKAEEARQAAEQRVQQEARQKAQQEARQKAQQRAEEAFRAAESNPSFLAKRKAEIFIRVCKIISEQLSIDEAGVTLDSHLSNDLGADPLDLLEFMMALEEELDVEISDEDVTKFLDVIHPSMDSWLSTSNGKTGEKTIVRNVVELIWKNAPYFWENTSS